MLSCTKYVYTFLFSSSVIQSLFSFTRPPIKSSTLPIRKLPVFQCVGPWHTTFTSSCVIPLSDSATAHSPSVKELNPSYQEDARFSGRCTLACNFHFILHPLWDLATAHSRYGKELKLPSLEKSCFSGLIVLLMFSYYPAWALFGLVLTHITH